MVSRQRSAKKVSLIADLSLICTVKDSETKNSVCHRLSKAISSSKIIGCSCVLGTEDKTTLPTSTLNHKLSKESHAVVHVMSCQCSRPARGSTCDNSRRRTRSKNRLCACMRPSCTVPTAGKKALSVQISDLLPLPLHWITYTSTTF